MWLKIRGFDYEVSEDGYVRRMSDNWYIARTVTSHGYLQVVMRRGNKYFARYVHRLVLQTFVGPAAKGMQACHNNGDRSDPRLSNLRWDTYSGNHMDKWKHGTMPHGVLVNFTKLTEEQVRQIKSSLAAGEKGMDLADRYGVTFQAISKIKTGKNWKWVQESCQ